MRFSASENHWCIAAGPRISSTSSNTYTEVSAKQNTINVKGKNGKYGIIAAEFVLDAASEYLYDITMPEELALRNNNGNSCITAVIDPGYTGEVKLLSNGQKKIRIGSELILDNGLVKGKHSSIPFEITVNLN